MTYIWMFKEPDASASFWIWMVIFSLIRRPLPWSGHHRRSGGLTRGRTWWSGTPRGRRPPRPSRRRCDIGVTLTAGWRGEELPRLVPYLIGTHALRIELIRHPLDSNLNLWYFRVIEGLSIPTKGLVWGLKDEQAPPHSYSGRARWGWSSKRCRFYPWAPCGTLTRGRTVSRVALRTGWRSFGPDPAEKHQTQTTDVFNSVRGVGSSPCCFWGLDHTVVVVEGQLVLEAVAERALVKRHVTLEYLDIQRDIEPIRERIGDGLIGRDRLVLIPGANLNPRRVPVRGRVNTLVVPVFSLRGCSPEVGVAMINVAVGDRHNFVPRNLDRVFFFTMARPRF